MSVVSLNQLTFQRIGWCVKKAHCQPAFPYSFGERSYLSFVVRRVRDKGLPVILNKPRAFRGAVKDLVDNGQRMNMKKYVRDSAYLVLISNEILLRIYRYQQKVWHSLYRHHE